MGAEGGGWEREVGGRIVCEEEKEGHDLHREVIGRQTRTKRLAVRHCVTRVSGLHASDACRRLTLHTLKRGLVRNPRESLFPCCQLRLLLRCQNRHNPRADHRLQTSEIRYI